MNTRKLFWTEEENYPYKLTTVFDSMYKNLYKLNPDKSLSIDGEKSHKI